MEWKRLYRAYAKPIKLGIFLTALIAGMGVFYWQVSLAHQADTGVWGIADAKESNVNSKMAGRVVALYVKEGDTVYKGQKIEADAETIQKQQAQAALAAQLAQVRQVSLSSDSTKGKLEAALAQAQAQAVQAKAAEDLASRDEARYAALLQQDAVPR